MTNAPPTKSNHGGSRAGAGRKKKAVRPTFLDETDVQLLTSDAAPDFVETAAERHARLVIGALVKKGARVTAANAILDRGYGKPGVDIGGDAVLPFAPMPAASGVAVNTEMRTEARKYARLAIGVLARISTYGQSESASVAAGKAILDRALGTVGVARMPPEFARHALGKKEVAARAADEAAVGRYATPQPPKKFRQH
jgi:hypothetical protein